MDEPSTRSISIDGDVIKPLTSKNYPRTNNVKGINDIDISMKYDNKCTKPNSKEPSHMVDQIRLSEMSSNELTMIIGDEGLLVGSSNRSLTKIDKIHLIQKSKLKYHKIITETKYYFMTFLQLKSHMKGHIPVDEPKTKAEAIKIIEDFDKFDLYYVNTNRARFQFVNAFEHKKESIRSLKLGKPQDFTLDKFNDTMLRNLPVEILNIIANYTKELHIKYIENLSLTKWCPDIRL